MTQEKIYMGSFNYTTQAGKSGFEKVDTAWKNTVESVNDVQKIEKQLRLKSQFRSLLIINYWH